MNIAIVGTDYVGLVIGACLAESGNRVVCIDNDPKKMVRLMSGGLPFYEPDLTSLVHGGVQAGTLMFSADLADGAGTADIVFLTVGTCAARSGDADLHSLSACAHALATILGRDTVVAVNTTVPVGTGQRLQAIFDSHRASRSFPISVTVTSNPEFLAEGRAVHDFRHPQRIVVGSDDPRAICLMQRLYAPYDPDGDRLLIMDRRSAEFTKLVDSQPRHFPRLHEQPVGSDRRLR